MPEFHPTPFRNYARLMEGSTLDTRETLLFAASLDDRVSIEEHDRLCEMSTTLYRLEKAKEILQ